MTKADVKALQHELNRWTKRFLRGVAPLIADGDKGAATNRRIKWVKYYLGYGKVAGDNSAAWTSRAARSLRHPRTARKDGLTAQQIGVGIARRTRQKVRAAQQGGAAVFAPGVTRYDGVPVAKWMVSYLQYARSHGWRGRLVSGYRTPAYSDSLCRRMCGAPRCPGRCAGRASNHSGSACPRGAVDVTDYTSFERIVLGAPYSPKLINRLDARDPVHFSVSGV